jgi:formylglycine-generating enzyme required for sulfatase activity
MIREVARVSLGFVVAASLLHTSDAASPGETKTGNDGKTMAWIPDGTFTMGSNQGNRNERPPHEVTVNGFWMDTHEVTNAEFAKFVEASGSKPQGDWKAGYTSGKEDHPIMSVTWIDAANYCKWAGKRLPTEAEWEYAAGGPGHYKWSLGNRFEKNKYSFDLKEIGPVGSYPPNGYGLYDMSGSAWEWVNDWYDGNFYRSSPKTNPLGPMSGIFKVFRGGSGLLRSSSYLRVSHRGWNFPDSSLPTYGFRCAG